MPLVANLSSTWATKINAKLPNLWVQRSPGIKKILEAHFDRVLTTAKETEATLFDHLEQNIGDVESVESSIDERVMQSIESFQRSADALEPTMDSVRSSMRGPFQESLDFTGMQLLSPHSHT